MYEIKKITYKDDTEKMNDKSLLLKGCIGNIKNKAEGQKFRFDLLKDRQGNHRSDYLNTSRIEHFYEDDDMAIVETLDEVYYFRKLA